MLQLAPQLLQLISVDLLLLLQDMELDKVKSLDLDLLVPIMLLAQLLLHMLELQLLLILLVANKLMELQQLILEPHQPHKQPMYQHQWQLDMLQQDTQQQDMPILDMQVQELDIDQSLKKSQSKAESNIFLLKLNTLNTIKSKELKEFHSKDKSLNINKSDELFRSQLKELLLIITQ